MLYDNHFLDGQNDVAMVCLNDIERSDVLLEDSTMEDVEMELNNNGGEEAGMEASNLSSSHQLKSSSQQNLSSVSVNRSCFQLQQPRLPPPPAPVSFQKFLGIVNTQFNQPKGTQPVTLSVPIKTLDLHQKLVIEQETSFQGLLRRHNEQMSEKEEVTQLKKKLEKLSGELEEAKRSAIASRKKYSGQVKLASSDQEEVRKKLEKLKVKAARVDGTLNEKKKEHGKHLAKMRSTVEEFNTHLALFKCFGIELLVNTGDESGIENSSPNSTTSWRSNEIALQLTNINPNNPEEVFYIQMKQMSLAESSFTVHSIFPGFDEAYDVVQKANSSQDFLNLVLDCKTYWLKRSKLPLSENVEVNVIDADTTKELFNSPTSVADSTKDLFESPLSDVSGADN